MRPEALRTIYLPRMSDHALAVAAAMRAVGLDAEALPEPDGASMAAGLAQCRGTECLPCFLCTGDFLRKCREPGFDPRRAVFFVPTGPGPCRFGQYRVLQRSILEDQGFGGVEIVSPTTDDSYALFGDDPVRLRKLAWQGIVAVDLLTKVLHEHRPYEAVPGSSDEAYAASLDDTVRALEAGGGDRVTRALGRAARSFAEVETRGRQSRPAVAVIGELYLMLNRASNLELVRAVERAGGEVVQGTFSDWLYFVDWRRKTEALQFRRYGDFLETLVSGAYQKGIEHRFARALRPVLRRPADAPVAEAVKALRACWEPDLGTEATLTMARILDIARHGLSGIVNVLPFSCMPGSVVACMGPRLRKERKDIPWLDIAFDGQKETNLQTRLEAFMHQAARYHRRVVDGRREEMTA
jgi:predicted nucleotide-binding protein (sugar kinase/HSP70/actin superfamily)